MSGGTAGTNININIIQCLLYTHDMRIQHAHTTTNCQ